MKKCPNCGAELDDDVRFCPDCGEPLVGKKNRGGRKGIGCGGIFKVLKVLFFIVIVVIFLIAKKNGALISKTIQPRPRFRGPRRFRQRRRRSRTPRTPAVLIRI